VLEPGRQDLGQATLANLCLGAGDVVRNPLKARAARCEIEEEPGGARVAVARLADRAGVEEPAVATQLQLGPVRSEGKSSFREGEAEGNVAVADQDEVVGRHPERRLRDVA
jgi:hypothetical protein